MGEPIVWAVATHVISNKKEDLEKFKSKDPAPANFLKKKFHDNILPEMKDQKIVITLATKKV